MKKGFIIKAITLSLIFGGMFIGTNKVNAADLTKVSGLRQTESTQDSVKFSYNKTFSKISRYVIEFSYDGVTFERMTTTTGTDYTVRKLLPGTDYYVRVKTELGNEAGPVSDTLKIVTSPKSVKNIKQVAATSNSVTISWDSSDGADYYVLTDNAGKALGKTTDTTYTVSGYNNTEKFPYVIHVLPVNTNGSYEAMNDEYEVDYANYVGNLKLIPGKTTGLRKIDFDKKEGTVKYANDKILFADGYQYVVYKSTNNKKVATFSVTGSSSSFGQIISLNNCIKKRVWYKVKARAYITVDKTTYYGEWSDWDYVTGPVGSQATRKNRKAINLTWNKIAGSDYYVVYVSKNSKSKYELVKTTKNINYTVKNIGKKSLKKKQKYFIRVKAVKNVDGETYYGYTKTIRKK